MTHQREKSDAKSALRRLMLVLTVALGFIIYAYGWSATDIDLDTPQEPQRQENVTNALQQLLSPRFFSQERELAEISANFLMDCSAEVDIPPPPTPETGGLITLMPDCGMPGDEISIELTGFVADADSRIRWNPPDGQTRPRDNLVTNREEIVLDSNGDFKGLIEVPRIRGSEGQIHQVTIVSAAPSGPILLSETGMLVIQRMIETIFMALVATSVAIPIAAVISFLSARNLMRPIRLTLGSLFIVLLSFALGVAVGLYALTPLGSTGVDLGQGSAGWIAALLALFISVGLLYGTLKFTRHLHSDGWRAFTVRIVIMLALLFVIGTIAGLSASIGEIIVSFGESLRPADLVALLSENAVAPLNLSQWSINALADAFKGVGRMLNTIGEVLILLMPTITAIATGVTISSMASRLLAAPLRRTTASLSHVLAAIMGALSAALLMGFVATLALNAALLGLLPLLVASILGGSITSLIYQRFLRTSRQKEQFQVGRLDRLAGIIAFAAGALIVLWFTYNLLSLSRSLVDGTLPQQRIVEPIGITLYVWQCMLIGAVLGAVGGGLGSLQAVFPLGTVLYNVARTALNTVRSIEPLIMGLVFVIWVGIGPFAGVLALTLHSIAALGKLYSEQIESIDPGPIEAIQSTGASWLQTIVYAVVPQIIPPYIAFTMYRWDINVRMSTIIGFVGGGGIGLLLNQWINLLRYRDAGVAVIAIAIVVSILDYTSASIREKLT